MKMIWINPFIICTTVFAVIGWSHTPASSIPSKSEETGIQLTTTGLSGRYFVLEAINGIPVTFDTRQPELQFGQDFQLSGSMCNRFHGATTLEGTTLKAPQLASTRMLCEPRLNELERNFFQMMQNGATLAVSENKLVIRDPQTHATLTFKSAIPPTAAQPSQF